MDAHKYAVLVYQAGIANVFEVKKADWCEATEWKHYADHNGRSAIRLLQQAFTPCEFFAMGLQRAGWRVCTMWCNQAGDIANREWRFGKLGDAPFSDRFMPVGDTGAFPDLPGDFATLFGD